MREKKEEEPEVKVYDFTKVKMEVRFGEFVETDLSKILANNIHQNTGDIGLDEIARAIYKDGRAGIPRHYASAIVAILEGGTNLVVAAKQSIISILKQQES